MDMKGDIDPDEPLNYVELQILAKTGHSFNELLKDKADKKRVEAFLSLPPITRTFKFKIPDPETKEIASSSSTMSGKKSQARSSSKFSLDDVDCVLSSFKKEATPSSAPLRPAFTRSKASAGKRKKIAGLDDEFEVFEKSLFESASQHIASLKRAQVDVVKELQENLELMKASKADQERAFTKKLRDLQIELEMTRSKTSEELKATVNEAKLWAAKSVVAARVKMAKEAAEPGFDRAKWDLAKWEQQMREFEIEDEGEDQSVIPDKEEVAVVEGGGASMGNEVEMQV